MKPVWYFDEVFQRNIYFFHQWKIEDYKSYLTKTYKIEFDLDKYLTGEVREFTNGPISHLFLFTKKEKSKPHAFATLSHECNHLANHIFKQHGVKADWNNDEFESYYKEMLFRKALGQ